MSRPARKRASTTSALAVALGAAFLLQPLAATPSYAGAACGSPVPFPGDDCTAPTTVITSEPDSTTTATAAQFDFEPADQEGRVTWECRLDDVTTTTTQVQDWGDCTTPADPFATESHGSKLFTGLQRDHTYRFSVRADDNFPLGANVEDPPKTRTWTVVTPVDPPDVDAPETTITRGADRWQLSDFVGIRYRSEAGVIGYRCTLDGKERSCDDDGQTEFYRLGVGDHVFRVAAVDSAGNVDPTPATNRWTIPVDDNRLGRSKGWKDKRGSGYFKETYSITRKRGAEAHAVRKKVRSVALATTQCSDCGTVAVYLEDRLLKRVDLSKGKRRHKVILLGSWTRARTVKLKVEVTSSGRNVIIDGIWFSRRKP